MLLSTEAGGEGRNFQFAHILVNHDLPWNPMKIEQRMGRLDRIGQKCASLVLGPASGCREVAEQAPSRLEGEIPQHCGKYLFLLDFPTDCQHGVA